MHNRFFTGNSSFWFLGIALAILFVFIVINGVQGNFIEAFTLLFVAIFVVIGSMYVQQEAKEKYAHLLKMLSEAEAREAAILGSIGDGLILSDPDMKVTYINTAASTMLGMNNKQAAGKLVWDVVRKRHEDDTVVPPKEYLLQQAVREGRLVIQKPGEGLLFTKVDGTRFPVAMSVAPIRLEGKILGGVTVFRDVSIEREVDKAKTEFVSLASHQLRTPLSTISWYAELLLNGDAGRLTAKQRRYIDEIYTGNQRMIALVSALLNVSRIELGTFSVDPEPTDIVALAKDTIHELKPGIVKKKLHVTETYGKGIPKLNLDPRLTRIIFQNLISNAIKYTHAEGEIAVNVQVKAHNIVIAVSDNGIGIPLDQQDEIFSKLFRATNVQEADTDGTGLGLYLVKAVVDHSGGKVWFDSKQHKGTTFYVELPLHGMQTKKGSRNLEV